MIWTYILLSLLFAFVYWWYMDEGRLERYGWLVLFLGNGIRLLWYGVEDAMVVLSLLMMVMVSQWYIGFKTGYGAIHGPQ